MGLLKADIETIVVGSGPVSSLLVLKTYTGNGRTASTASTAPSASGTQPLPIRIGSAEAASIGMALSHKKHARPMTFDLMAGLIKMMGLRVDSCAITDVEGTTFFARINISKKDGSPFAIDARPSDAIALAVKTGAPLYVDESVLETASLPNFDEIKRQYDQKNLKEFEQFVQTIKPEDFE